ncbi:MAG: nucleotidyl transferase AbiEii/AbiGii toxin family protein [Planctomycetota bacterium]
MEDLIQENTVLSAAQKEVLRHLPQTIRESFVFSGGTALAAFHLHHRQSEDLDFFALRQDTPVRGDELEHALGQVFTVRDSGRIFDRRLFRLDLGEMVKVEFAPLYWPRLGDPLQMAGLQVEALPDLAANKILAISDRFDVKDFVDVFCIARATGWTVAEMIELAYRKHPARYEYQVHLSRIREHREAVRLLRMLRPLDGASLVAFFEREEEQLIRREVDIEEDRDSSS